MAPWRAPDSPRIDTTRRKVAPCTPVCVMRGDVHHLLESPNKPHGEPAGAPLLPMIAGGQTWGGGSPSCPSTQNMAELLTPPTLNAIIAPSSESSSHAGGTDTILVYHDTPT